jgi:hypothetical protein
VSLVVAEIHDETVSLVADTKISFRGDPSRTRQVFQYALPKLLILRDTLAAGYAGSQPERILRALVGARELAMSSVLEQAQAIPHASIAFASLDPDPQLWKVSNGQIENRSSIGRSWVGDQQAYEFFQRRYHGWPDGTDAAFRLMSSMQWLLSFQPVPSVGGYLTRISTTKNGFRYAADTTTVGPWQMQATRVRAVSDSYTLEVALPDGGETTSYSIRPAVGRPPTPGALAYLIPEAGTAQLFPQESPWQPIKLAVSSMANLISHAADEHGQTLTSGLDPLDSGQPLSQTWPPGTHGR